jgi:hypothetical protein
VAAGADHYDPWNPPPPGSATATHTVNVQGASCEFVVCSERSYAPFAHTATELYAWSYLRMPTPYEVDDRCTPTRLYVKAEYVNTQGDSVSASAELGHEGFATVCRSDLADLTRSVHEVHFNACNCVVRYTLSHPK